MEGDLALIMAWGEVAAADVADQRFIAARDVVGAGLARAKEQRYLEMMGRSAGWESVFQPAGAGTENDYCRTCHRELTHGGAAATNSDEAQPACTFCASFEQLAREIAHDDLWMVVEPWSVREVPAPTEETWRKLLARATGWRYQFMTGRPATIKPGGSLYRLNSTELLLPHDCYRFLANSTPRNDATDVAQARKDGRDIKEYDIKDFETMARQADGIHRVGVLRMDIDNLGAIFGQRLQGSMAQVSALSEAMTLFFCGHLNRICAEVEAGRSKTL